MFGEQVTAYARFFTKHPHLESTILEAGHEVGGISQVAKTVEKGTKATGTKVAKTVEKTAKTVEKGTKAAKLSKVGAKKAGKKGVKRGISVKFPSKTEIARRLGTDVETFHRVVKKNILEDFKSLIRKKGVSNPDICVDSLGNIVLKDPRTGRTISTSTPLSHFSLT